MTLRDLVELVARLRGPEGCPWDREQRLVDLRAYLLEEAHELAAAIDGGDWSEIAVELGDLLFQAAFVARLGEESGSCTADEVIAGVYRKMVERHPHVFGDQELADAGAVHAAWERRKAAASPEKSHLSGVSDSLPALLAAYRLGQKAAGVGFDWQDARAVMEKVDEEVAELRTALDHEPADREALAEELGDLLFALASLGRHLQLDAEAVLAAANRKFRRRFAAMERLLREEGAALASADLERLEAVWQRVKGGERGE